jgi:hypothetical protein
MSGARPGDGPGSAPPSGVDSREDQDRLRAPTRPSVRIRQHGPLTIRISQDRNSLVMRAAGRSREDGDRLRIDCGSPAVRQLIDLTGLGRELPLTP